MKKVYSIPCVEIVKLTSNAILLSLSGSEAASDAEALGKGGMTPVSEDNANSIWED